LHSFRRLRIRWERRDDIHEACLGIAVCLITHRHVQGFVRASQEPEVSRGHGGLAVGVVAGAVDATVDGDPVRAHRRETAGGGEADRVLVAHAVDAPGAQVPAQTVVGAQV
jgi:hypothetical protein